MIIIVGLPNLKDNFTLIVDHLFQNFLKVLLNEDVDLVLVADYETEVI
jgi:hypothetical protein